MTQLTKHFSDDEFRCPSGECDMDVDFMKRLEMARKLAKIPFIITSGYRSVEYNQNLSAINPNVSQDSAHTKGLAADISVLSSQSRWIIVAALQAAGFRRIGIGDSHIHVDMDVTKPQDVLWLY